MKKVKLGFMGCGFMGQLAHMSNYAQLEDCEIVAVCDSKSKQAEMVARAYGIPKVYGSCDEFLKDNEIEAVVAAQPFENHVNIVPGILQAKKHLLTEKPLCVHPDNAKTLARCAADNGRVHMVAYHKRSDPASEYAQKVIREWKASGEMGRMNYVRIAMPPGDWVGGANKMIASDEQNEQFVREPLMPGMDEKTQKNLITFVNYYIHQVNYLRFLLGEDYRLSFADKSGKLLVVESDGGVSGIIEMAAYTTTDDWQEEALVCFDKGWVKVELVAPLAAQQAGRVTVFENHRQQGMTFSPRLPNRSAMRNQAANFIKAVQGEAPPPCSSGEAVRDLEIAMDYIDFMKRYRND